MSQALELAVDSCVRMSHLFGDPNYLFHFPRKKTSYIGFGCEKRIEIYRNRLKVFSGDQVECKDFAGNPVEQLANLIDPECPAVFLLSQDYIRNFQDDRLPLFLCLQPKHEVELVYSGRESKKFIHPESVSSSHWDSQSDDQFVKRLHDGISLLAQYEGKLIVSRGYQKKARGDLFKFFEIFAGREPTSACSHYIKISENIQSVGCSPENVFELEDRRLVFDVVASTRGISPDPEKDRRWIEELKSDPKEIREHMMAFNRYQARMESLVEKNSLSIDQFQDVLEMGMVRHLHSKLSGDLRSDLNWVSLLKDSFPPLTSYPAELAERMQDNPEPNRYYGGVVGRVAPNAKTVGAYLNIRALLSCDETLYTQGGVGVIAESSAEKELLEVKNKLRGLMTAVDIWQGLNCSG